MKGNMKFRMDDGSQVEVLDGEHLIFQGRKVRLDKYGLMHLVEED